MGEASVYRLKITLRDVRPSVWRRIETFADTTLEKLHLVIQAAMGWEDAHLHSFVVGRSQFGPRDSGCPLDERGVRLDSIAGLKERFEYDYDFGDGWSHGIVVESIGAPEKGVSYPRFIGGRNACPPEDVGGPYGYEELLEAIADPDHQRHDELKEWIGGAFDPASFEVARIEAAFRRLAGRRNPRETA